MTYPINTELEHFSVKKDRVYVKFQRINTTDVADRRYTAKIIHTTDTREVTWVCNLEDLSFLDLAAALSGNKPTMSLAFGDEKFHERIPIEGVIKHLKALHGNDLAMTAVIAYTIHETGYHVRPTNLHRGDYPLTEYVWECVLTNGKPVTPTKFPNWESAVFDAWRLHANRSGLRDLWRPTHKITFWHRAPEPITWTVGVSPTGVICTFEEWVDGTESPAWTRAGDAWLHRGNTTPWAMIGQLEVHEIRNHDTDDG